MSVAGNKKRVFITLDQFNLPFLILRTCVLNKTISLLHLA